MGLSSQHDLAVVERVYAVLSFFQSNHRLAWSSLCTQVPHLIPYVFQVSFFAAFSLRLLVAKHSNTEVFLDSDQPLDWRYTTWKCSRLWNLNIHPVLEKKKSSFFLDLHFFGVFHYQVEKVTFLGLHSWIFFLAGGKREWRGRRDGPFDEFCGKWRSVCLRLLLLGVFSFEARFLDLKHLKKSMYDYWISIYIQILVGQQKSEIVGTSFGITIYNPFKRKPKKEVHPQSWTWNLLKWMISQKGIPFSRGLTTSGWTPAVKKLQGGVDILDFPDLLRPDRT